jgi:hypothetical protein
LPVASTFSGLDGGMNKVFLARFPDRIIPLAIVLTNGPQLPQMSPILWTDNNGSLADKVFSGSFESRSPSQTQVVLTASPMQEPRANLAITKRRPAD